MVSFLTNCPQCGVMIPKDTPCPDCRLSDRGQQEIESDQATAVEFARRMKVHTRNYTIFMILMFVAGLVSLLTAGMWSAVIYRGDVRAFLLIGVLTVFAGGLNLFLWFSKSFFPLDVHCPACELRLEDLGIVEHCCPSCSAYLR